MTCEVLNSARRPEMLPAYTARSIDADTTSIHSAAPSYTSAAPSYHSVPGGYTSLLHPSSRSVVRSSTPSRRINVDGSASRRPPSNINISAYSIPSWSSMRSSHQERHYHSVAHRRANAAVAAAAAAAESTMYRDIIRVQPPAIITEDILEEDPYLVGSEAAEQARKERLTKQQANEALEKEEKAWDFMHRQMADWEARERSWATFRRESEKPGLLRRKIRMFGLGRW